MPSKSCSCKQKCPEAVLEKVHIDWRQNSGKPKAVLRLKDCPYPKCGDNACLLVLELTWRALIKQPNHVDKYVHKTIKVVLQKDCKIEFEIPLHTNELSVDLNVKLGDKFAKDGCCVRAVAHFKQWDEFGLGFLRYLSGQDLLDMIAIVNSNRMICDAVSLDHSPVQPDEEFPGRVAGHQPGPCRGSRSMAIVHIAVFDAAVAVKGGYESYSSIAPSAQPSSLEAAILKASYDTVKWLYPSHAVRLDSIYNEMIDSIPNGVAKDNGIDAGRRSAEAIINDRSNDGSNHPEQSYDDWHAQHNPDDVVPIWQKDPIGNQNVALGARWAELVRPFAIENASVYRAPAPPALDSREYEAAFNEPKYLGGDRVHTYTVRSAEQEYIGNYYGYDGSNHLGVPPVLYNQMAIQILEDNQYQPMDVMRALALLNVSLADAGLAAWDTKYFYNHWRPVTAIRRASEDGNPNTIANCHYTPLGAPSSNSDKPNATPGFPAYVSGHATFGASLFQTLRHLLGSDDVPFTFVSDEYNGVTKDNQGHVRPFLPRSFRTLSQAEDENAQSRMYLGIHWNYDKVEGIKMGHKVADFLFSNYFRKL